MASFSSRLTHVGADLVKRAAAQQGGLLSGQDPTAFDTADPIRLWIIQLSVITMVTQILSLGLGRMKQPKVIAEVLCGIVLGPSLMGRIPGFTKHVFPVESRPYLTLTADIGLVLFLFLVGLEIDIRVLKRNARASLAISLGGMVLPFGLGAAVAVPLYSRFVDHQASTFGHFLLFVGVAFSITAFPVLCRILTALQLLDTTVGVVALSAGVLNDIVGWTLLALTVALVNASSGLTALWVLLCSIAWTIFLLVLVKRAFLWLARKTGSIENGPTPIFMTCTILLVFASAFFTDIIGVNAIFGGFLAGLCITQEGGLAIALTEKLEDMVSIIFLPLYFTLSGLSTDLGLLSTGIIWGHVIMILVLAYFGKFVGGSLAARATGFRWREAGTIGALMSCKGLVELIVLNVGLQAGILDTLVFTMFVVEALVLTFLTTPVTLALYPSRHRVRVAVTGSNFASVEDAGGDKRKGGDTTPSRDDYPLKSRFTVVLDRLEHLPALMGITQLLRKPLPVLPQETTPTSQTAPVAVDRTRVDALRLVELTERTSAVMRSSMASDFILTDHMVNIFRTYGDLNDVPISPSLVIVSRDQFTPSVVDHAVENNSDLIIISWLPPTPRAPGGATSDDNPAHASPFDALFRTTPSNDNPPSVLHSHFIRGVFSQSPVDVALYVEHRRAGPRAGRGKKHMILPFFGGPDDRLALSFVVQLCSQADVTATVIRITKVDPPTETDTTVKGAVSKTDAVQGEMLAAALRENNLTIHSTTGFPDTLYPHATTQTRLESETADNLAWARHTSPPSPESSQTTGRVAFEELTSSRPLHDIVERVAAAASDPATKLPRSLIVATGRARRLAVESHHQELRELLSENSYVGSEIRKTVGDVATALITSRCPAALIVLQAAKTSDD
ncbi:hypothetical protein BOTBODRAFT_65764 [Botryobasidium botryosum FD-172 SS1]|uniref:Cation/H+ exchanger transmembrane domain-containing protein n=1 Tax=Botryobasidium botryosum (strain FD-172 SS1) TaxID=930990 RepID=A0A067MTE4_BOTB1|nr:hypothetical protein BOTBODRAFT_65764 [Botryobasidium botryosum FD-172 SS1]